MPSSTSSYDSDHKRSSRTKTEDKNNIVDIISKSAKTGSLDSHQIINSAVSGIIINIISNIKGSKFNPRLILILLLVVSLNEIKSGMADCIKGTKEHLPKIALKLLEIMLQFFKLINPQPFLTYLNPISWWRLCRPNRSQQKAILPPEENKSLLSEIDIAIPGNKYIVTAIHRYCLAKDIGKCRSQFELQSDSAVQHLHSMEYSDICLQAETFQIKLLNNLKLKYDIDNNVKEYTIAGSHKTYTLHHDEDNEARDGEEEVDDEALDDYDWYTNIEMDDIKSEVKRLYSIYMNRILSPDIKRLIDTATDYNIRQRYRENPFYQNPVSNTSLNLLNLLIMATVELFDGYYREDIIILLCLTKAIRTIFKDAKTTLSVNNQNYLILKINDRLLYNMEIDPLDDYDYSIKKITKRAKFEIKKDFNIEDYFSQTDSEKCENLNFKIITNNPTDNKRLYQKFFDFYKNELLASTGAKENSCVTVYSIEFIKEEGTVVEDNPKYIEWQEQLDSLKELGGGNSRPIKDLSDKEGAESDESPKKTDNVKGGTKSGKRKTNVKGGFKLNMMPFHGGFDSFRTDSRVSEKIIEMLGERPPKTIEKSKVTYKLDCNPINKVYKGLDTLYMRQLDKRILSNMLDKFRNKKELYTQLGIPYKLGMLFHGIPGTGKTSAIKAVASYLGKDIYFVHLKHVRTNRDLKAIFDHINDKCNGGVVVLEDIDAATDVVYRRDEHDMMSQAQTVSSVLESTDDGLTLSYLLNILDGTLCNDGTIFAITTNHLEKLDPALYRKGRIDVTIEFKLCDHYQIGQIYQSILGRTLKPEVLAKIPENRFPPCEIIFNTYQYLLDDLAEDEVIMKPFIE